jgi:hypothetical protein
MSGRCGALALAAVVCAAAGAGVASAQTVIVRNAPAGSTLELVFDTETIGSVKADAKGEASLPVNLAARGRAKDAEADVNITIDVCEGSRRVLLLERGLQPPALQGVSCTRHQIPELFVLRSVTTLVVDMAPATPTVWLRQGKPPANWLRDETQEEREAAKERRPSPTGVVLFGGYGLVKITNVVDAACGTVSECSGDDFVSGFTGGMALWVTRWLAFEASYTRPFAVTASADPQNDFFSFQTDFDTHIVNLTAKAGLPIGPIRIFGHGGATYHQANFITDQVNDPFTVPIDDVDVPVPGGTQTFTLRTDGWGYHYGGGLEAWLSNKWALYGEVTRSQLKGDTLDEGEGELDSTATALVFGVRFRIGG